MLSRAALRRARYLLGRFSNQKPGQPQQPTPPPSGPKQSKFLVATLGMLAIGAPAYFFGEYMKNAQKNVKQESKKPVASTFVLNKPKEEPVSAEVEIFQTKADLNEGEKRAVQVGPKEEDAVLVIKQNGKYYCIQDKCSHFGFSLAKGNLFGEKIVCPLHHAVFSIETGRPEAGPIFDGLQTYKVTEHNGILQIEVPKGYLNVNKTTPMAKKTNDGHPIVIIGGGPAALSAVETLRQAGFEGSITMISKEASLPYDRTALSKNLKANSENTAVRKADFYSEYGINIKKGESVQSINYAKKEVSLSDGSTVPYEKLLIASGAETVVPKIVGADQVPQITLRTLADLEKIRSAIKDTTKNITIVGAGFIGIELSSSLKAEYKDKVNVTLLDSQSAPLQRVFGPEVGKSVQALAEKNGVKFELSAQIKQVRSDNHQVVSVELGDKSVPTDLIIFATGVRPVTNFVGNLEIDRVNGGIKTNTYLKTSNEDVYAAGDVASYPYWLSGGSTRVEHWNQAIYEGSIAALNILGKKIPLDNVPFFWTRSFNNSVQFTGVTTGYDKVHIAGDLAAQKFIAYYFKAGKVVGAATMNSLNSIMIINEALQQGVMPSAEEVSKSDFKLNSLIPLISTKKPTCTKCQCIA